MNNYLIFRTDRIGDFLLTAILIKSIKRNDPGCYIYLVSSEKNFDYINSNGLKNISFLYRKIDQYSWKYCNKGFFNFKNYIPKIINEFI